MKLLAIFSLISYAYGLSQVYSQEFDNYKINNTLIEVDDMVEMNKIYGPQFNSNDGYGVFYLKQENLFMIRLNEEINIEDNKLDKRFFSRKQSKYQVEWIQLNITDRYQQQYPGYIPITECQSVKYGYEGEVSFEYTLSNLITSNIGLSFALSRSTGWRGIIHQDAINSQMTLGIQTGDSSGGKISCRLKANQTGQVMMKPMYHVVQMEGRRVRWMETIKNWTIDEDYTRYEPLYTLIENNHYQMDCFTDDVVELFCHEKIGEPKWDHPREEYELKKHEL